MHIPRTFFVCPCLLLSQLHPPCDLVKQHTVKSHHPTFQRYKMWWSKPRQSSITWLLIPTMHMHLLPPFKTPANSIIWHGDGGWPPRHPFLMPISNKHDSTASYIKKKIVCIIKHPSDDKSASLDVYVHVWIAIAEPTQSGSQLPNSAPIRLFPRVVQCK